MDKNIIGICIGSANTVIGTYNKGTFEVVLNDSCSRSIPTIVSYEDRERKYGEIKRKNNKRTIIYPNRWLGIQENFWIFNNESAYSIIAPIVNNNLLSFKIKFKNKTDYYTPECLMGLFFNKIKNIWQKKGINPNEIVFSIPDYCIAHERQAMLDSIKIGGLKCTSLLNESSAIALAYGMQYLKEFDDNPKIVTFIDLGHSHTTIIYGEFRKALFKVLSVTNERFCGARELDYLIAQNITNIFLQKYGIDPMDSPKAKVSLIEKINKSRKALTGNKEMNLHIDSLMDGQDLDYNLKREDFEKIIEPVLKKFEKICKMSLENAKSKGINIDNIHSVEMVGDTLRTPKISDIVEEIFKRKLSKTLVPDEFIARGCSIFALMNLPNKQINYSFIHYNPYSVKINISFNNINGLNIFLEGDDIPSTKIITFEKCNIPLQYFTIELFYDIHEPNLEFLPDKTLYTYKIILPSEQQKIYDIKLIFILDLNCIPRLDKAIISTKNFEDEKLEIPLQFELEHCPFGIPNNKLNEYIKREIKQNKEDIILEKIINYKNSLENYLYDIRDKIKDDNLNNSFPLNEKNQLIQKMEELYKWLSEDKDDLYDKNKLKEKGNEIKIIGDKIYNKYNEITGDEKNYDFPELELDEDELNENNVDNNDNQENDLNINNDNNDNNDKMNISNENLNEIEMNNNDTENKSINNDSINSNENKNKNLDNNSRLDEENKIKNKNIINNTENYNNNDMNNYNKMNNMNINGNNVNNINNKNNHMNNYNNKNINNMNNNINNNMNNNMNMNNYNSNIGMNNVNNNMNNYMNNNININNFKNNFDKNNLNRSMNMTNIRNNINMNDMQKNFSMNNMNNNSNINNMSHSMNLNNMNNMNNNMNMNNMNNNMNMNNMYNNMNMNNMNNNMNNNINNMNHMNMNNMYNNMNMNNMYNNINGNNNMNNSMGMNANGFPMNGCQNNGMNNFNDDYIKNVQYNYINNYTNLGYINLIFINKNRQIGFNILVKQNEPFASAINKYINASGDSNPNLYCFNETRLDETKTIYQCGLIDNSLIKVHPN